MTFEKDKYQNIIFDLGGVLLNLDYFRTVQAFRTIDPAFQSLDAVYSNMANKKMFEDYETGHITSEQFRDGVRKILGKSDVSDAIIDKAWNAMLLDLPKERLALLENLKKKHNLFLLSNTNEIHIKSYSDYLNRQYGFNNISHIFTKEYYSFEIGLRKPNAAIFEFVLSENKLNKNTTFFIDDSPEHIEGARSIGIEARLLKKGETILDVFVNL